MSFEKLIRIPNDRIGALIGKSGNVKSSIEKSCFVSIDIDGDNGEVFIKSVGDVEKMQPFKAMEIVSAIGRGFSPENAMTLLEGENTLHVIDLREFAGKSNANVERELFVINVPYSLKYTFVPLWIARTLVTWYFVPSVIWIVYSADLYVATAKLWIAVWDVEVVVVEGV